MASPSSSGLHDGPPALYNPDPVFFEQWSVFSIQLNGFSRVITINHLTFTNLGDTGQAFFKERSSELLNVRTEFIMDGYNHQRVYLAHPTDLQNQFPCQVVPVQGMELPLMFPAPNFNAPMPQVSMYPPPQVQVPSIPIPGGFTAGSSTPNSSMHSSFAAGTSTPNSSMHSSFAAGTSTPGSSMHSSFATPSTGSSSSHKRKRTTDEHNGQANTDITGKGKGKMTSNDDVSRASRGGDSQNSQERNDGPAVKRSRKSREAGDPDRKKKIMNSFILFRSANRTEIKAQYPRYQNKNGIISKIIAIMWASMTDAEQKPWYDEYSRLKRLDPDFKDGEQRIRRKPKKEEDRLKAVAQLRLIQQQNANGEELTFSDEIEIEAIQHDQGENHISGPLGSNNNQQDSPAQGVVLSPGALNLELGLLQQFDQQDNHAQGVVLSPGALDLELELLQQFDQHNNHSQEVNHASQEPVQDLEHINPQVFNQHGDHAQVLIDSPEAPNLSDEDINQQFGQHDDNQQDVVNVSANPNVDLGQVSLPQFQQHDDPEQAVAHSPENINPDLGNASPEQEVVRPPGDFGYEFGNLGEDFDFDFALARFLDPEE
ncbi:hypothetical protein F4823DRAFT_633117 [Ustulina deusta]|nr:hypothetical protein F4823DRAFT_633117 [Ustulina deusta]